MNSKTQPIIVWFRNDLRTHDNPALNAAVQSGNPVLPLHISDNRSSCAHHDYANSWWLHHSLASLNQSLSGNLCLFQGKPETVLDYIIYKTGARKVYWNDVYEPNQQHITRSVKRKLGDLNVRCEHFNGSNLYQPGTVLKDNGTPYRVFTPFYKKAYANHFFRYTPLKLALENIDWFKLKSESLESLNLLPDLHWPQQFSSHWRPGEAGAEAQLSTFLEHGIFNYRAGRDFPAMRNVSRLSPHLHFGEISVSRIWDAVNVTKVSEKCEDDATHFLRELVWREFATDLLWHNPDLNKVNLNKKFDHFPWQENPDHLNAWQQGKTGYPIIDAGMRELWQTGYMHNRVRMIVASFLVKNLLIHWKHGLHWFEKTLLDADLANNSASWQWVAGCGADAAPFFRIFNPVTQGQKFDTNGEYVRRYVPEIASLPDQYIQTPWLAPTSLLDKLNISLGSEYPTPIVDLKSSRQKALSAFQQIR